MFVHFISFFAFIFLKFSSCLNPHLISFFQFSIFVIYLYFVFCFYLLKILSLTEFPRNPPEFSKWRKPRLHWVKNNQRWKCDKKFHGLIKPCFYAIFHNSGNPRCVLIGKKSKRWIHALNLNGKILPSQRRFYLGHYTLGYLTQFAKIRNVLEHIKGTYNMK